MTEEQSITALPEEIETSLQILKDKEVYVTGGTLYVVATPIGRIVDISVRAIKVLEGVDLIAAEDTRRSYILLNILGIRKEVISNQKFNEHRKTERFLQDLRDGKSIAIISDAGTPCISDPGNELIRRAIEEGFPVVPVPGACAAVSGVSASGFDLTSFIFCGFFPKENTERKEELKRLKSGVTRTFIYYESPKRIIKTVGFLKDSLPEVSLCLCNDLTKTHEKFYRGTPEEVYEMLLDNPNAEKGEFTLIIEVPVYQKEEETSGPSSPHAALIDAMISGCPTLRDAIEAVLAGDTDFKKNELKSAAIEIKALFEGE